MCGLFGGAGNTLVDVEIDRITQLGVVSQLRGTDSTGMLSLYRASGKINMELLKEVENSTEFFSSKKVNDHLSDKHPFIIAGHCRQATVGSVTRENAHPYKLEKVAGMKNGTLTGLKGHQTGETDSVAFLRLIQDVGIQKAFDESFGKGGLACVWIDVRDASLNFFRNAGRPLFFLNTAGAIYWASEAPMLDLVRARAGLTSANNKIEDLPPNTHRKYKIQNVMASPVDKLLVAEPVHYMFGRPVEPAKTEVTVISEDRVPIKIEKDLYSKYATKVNSPSRPFQIKGFRNKNLKHSKAKDLLQKGCAFCTKKLALGEADRAYFFNNKSFLCEDHHDDPAARLAVGARAESIYKGRVIIDECHGSC